MKAKGKTGGTPVMEKGSQKRKGFVPWYPVGSSPKPRERPSLGEELGTHRGEQLLRPHGTPRM